MNKLIVLELVDKKPCLQNYETHTLMKIKRSKRALKKLRKIDCENIVLSKNLCYYGDIKKQSDGSKEYE